MSSKKGIGLIGVIGWGPIEKLSNGHFVRMYSLIEHIVSKLDAKVILIEYTEGLRSSERYSIKSFGMKNAFKIQVPGNEMRSPRILGYVRFLLYQLINTIKLRDMMKKLKLIIIGGELFAPSLLLLRLINKNSLLIADPQMLLSEREERRGNKFLSYITFVLEKLFFTKSSMVIAISEDMAKSIMQKFEYPKEKIFVVPHALPSRLGTISYCRARSRERAITLAFVGDLEMQHNLEAATFIIRMLPLLKKVAKKNIKLLIVGRVGEKASHLLNDLVEKLGIKKEVEMLGYVEDIDDLLCNEADVLLAPMFTMSGVSTKMLNYLRFKDKIIVASREAVEGLEPIVERHGNVIIASNPKDFMLKLIDLVKDYGE
ncbi:MAG: glycosyltransferase [Ignisphaera sp.]